MLPQIREAPAASGKQLFMHILLVFPLQNPFGIITLSPGLVSHQVSHVRLVFPRSQRQHLVPTQGVQPTLLPAHFSKPTISSTVGG